MSPDRPYKRHILVINKSFQYKFIAIVVACTAVAIAIISIDMFSSLGKFVSSSFPGVDVRAIYRDSWIALAVKAAVYLSGIFVVALVVSHRIAGPMFRFEKSTEEIAKGNLNYRVYTREGDERQEFRLAFNAMTESLQKKVDEDVSRAGRVRRLLEDMQGNEALPPALQAKVKMALEDVSVIGSGFTLS